MVTTDCISEQIKELTNLVQAKRQPGRMQRIISGVWRLSHLWSDYLRAQEALSQKSDKA